MSPYLLDLTAIHNAGAHLLQLINDVLDISKIEAGKMELAFDDSVNIADLVNSAMSTAVGLTKDKPIRLERQIEEHLPLVRADATRVRQVLINFLSNAAKFTDQGSITVSIKRSLSPEGRPELRISVIDSGPGISAQDQARLFQPFTQVDSSPTRKVGGTGLGLSISRLLIELHNGRIGVDSDLGKGSTSYFTLPITGEKAQTGPLIVLGQLGRVHLVHGVYLQDWLLLPTDWNWRLEPELGGELRAIRDIGSHWLDLTSFVTGLEVEAVCTDFSTFIKERQKPTTPVDTFGGKLQTAVETVEQPIHTEDCASVLLHYKGGARGVFTVSQLSAGRKNRLFFEVNGSDSSLAWDGERPNELWIGRRDGPNQVVAKDPSLLGEEARRVRGPGPANSRLAEDAAGAAFDAASFMKTWPSNEAPSAIRIRGAVMLPVTLAELSSSTVSAGAMSPRTTPATTTTRPPTVPSTRP